MNVKIVNNCSNQKLSLFLLPLFSLSSIVLFLYSNNVLSVYGYVQIQKSYFYSFNNYLGQYPTIQYNLTQLGDASILLSFLVILVLYTPVIWEFFLSALLVSAIFSKVLKVVFLVPRPAQALNDGSFIIVGKKLVGFSSLPSGHSITFFTILTVLMFAFMPKKLTLKILWIVLLLTIGLIIVLTRVGVGAHWPLDIIIGSIIGYISGLLGIYISIKYKIWSWISNVEFYPIFMGLIIICSISITLKIINENLLVYYMALISLFVVLYKFIYVYIKK